MTRGPRDDADSLATLHELRVHPGPKDQLAHYMFRIRIHICWVYNNWSSIIGGGSAPWCTSETRYLFRTAYAIHSLAAFMSCHLPLVSGRWRKVKSGWETLWG